jgi:hypothetical protein
LDTYNIQMVRVILKGSATRTSNAMFVFFGGSTTNESTNASWNLGWTITFGIKPGVSVILLALTQQLWQSFPSRRRSEDGSSFAYVNRRAVLDADFL